MPGSIFTTHAHQRLQERSIPLSDAELALSKPDRTVPGKKPHTVKFIKQVHGRNIQLVATYLQDQDKWLVVSVWVRGEDDKVPLTWLVITAPFKLLWWLIKKAAKTARNI